MKKSEKNHLDWIVTKKSAWWQKQEKQFRLELFHDVAKRVPAYKALLRVNKINPKNIETSRDLLDLPPMSRAYLKNSSLDKLCWDGHLSKHLVFTSTSGTTDLPFYFPREEKLDWQSSVIHERFLLNAMGGAKNPTLVIVGFGMGLWIGGLITYQAFEMMRDKNYPISIITPGTNKEQIFAILKNVAPYFKQTVIAGYAPFIKDIIDEAGKQKIDLKKLNLRLFFAAEAFTEKFRDYLVKKAFLKNPLIDTMNIYGTADLGTMAFETPVSILIRRLAVKKPKLFYSIFGNIERIPTLAQYNPLFASFQEKEGELYVTGDNAIPFINYRLGDHGGVITFDSMKKILASHGINLDQEARKNGIKSLIYQLPFVYVYERADLSTKLHLRDIFPEMIRDVLIGSSFNKCLTGKFTMATKYNKNHDQYLEINFELRPDKNTIGALENDLTKKILIALEKKTTGPGNVKDFVNRPGLLDLKFWPYGHKKYFQPGAKQKWVKK